MRGSDAHRNQYLRQPTYSPPMSIEHGISAPTNRSPTQRHMHNYSLPSPSCASQSTTPRPIRCQSSPALSEFRQAIYIPATDIHRSSKVTYNAPVSNRGTVQVADTSSISLTTSPQAVRLDPGISLLAHNPALSAVCEENGGKSTLPFSSISLPTSPTTSTCRPSTSPSTVMRNKADRPKLNRFSALSIASLPFPLPTPIGLGSEAEWEIDPFAACTSYSSASTSLPQSKWSTPDSSPSPPPVVGLQRDQSAFEKLRADVPSPAKLKGFFGRLSMNRSPATSGFHFQTASKDGEDQEQLKRPDSRMTFVIVDEESPLIEDTRIDDVDILATSTILPVSHILEPDLSAVPSQLATGNIRCELRSSSVSTSSSTAISTEVSIAKDLDGIAVQDSLIIASVQNTLFDRVHVSPSFPSSTMRARSTAISKLPSLNLNDSRQKPRVKQPWELDIPPSPHTPPPHPPNTPPASESVARVPDPDCPPPAKFAFLPSASSLTAGETEMWIQKMLPPSPSPSPRRLPKLPTSLGASPVPNPSSVAAPAAETAPPTIPPRSKLRPPPPDSKRGRATTFSITGAFPFLFYRLAHYIAPGLPPMHSHSSSVASLLISPLSPPPSHSRSSSVASFVESSEPIPSQHSHSASVASSFMISPMPTPPPLSPTSRSSIATMVSPPWQRPLAPEPQIDMDVLRRLIFEDDGDVRNSNGSDESESESEVGASLKAIARAHAGSSNDEGSSTCTVTTPEFAWHEEPRAPPSRLSFYEFPAANRVHTSDIEDDDAISIYSQISSAYTFRSRSSSTRRMRSVRRNGKKGRTHRRMATMSVYSQASFSSRDTMNLPSVSASSCSLKDGCSALADDIPDKDLGDMVFEAPQYAYAFSWDDYVGHNLEGVALAGGSPSRSGADSEAQLPFSPRGNSRETPPGSAGNDWRALLTGPDQVKGKRRTSSNISVVENFIPTIQAPQLATIAGPAFAAVSPPATNGSVNDVPTTSTLSMSARALTPNRRQRTIRRLPTTLPTSPYDNYQRSSPTSPNSIFGADSKNPGRRHEKSTGGEPYLSARAEQTQASGVRSGLRGMRNRVSVLKSRLVALTVPSSSSRSPLSPSFPPKHAVESYERRYPIPSASSSATVPSSSAQWPSASVFPTASSTSSLPSGSASSLHSSSSPWSPGFSRRHTSSPRPAATRPPFHGAI